MNRLFFDIETSPNLVFTWNIGYELNISHESIIKEREIICICWKWAGKDKVHHLKWDKGSDKEMIEKFFKVILKADEVIGHNSDNFDIKWFKTRAIFHGIKTMPQFKTIDTLKISRQQFKFNSNKLDYIAKFLGLEGKIKTDYTLWKDIVLKNSTAAMTKMIAYCKFDVILLEKVFLKLEGYSKVKTNMSVVYGGSTLGCPRCGTMNNVRRRTLITAAGIKKTQRSCNDCGHWFQTPYTIQ